MITTAITSTGPYAILIMMGVKKVENRSAMPVPSRGRCAVSCSKSFCKEEFGEFVRWAAVHLQVEDFERVPSWGDVKDWPGKVVGCCDYEARQVTTGMSSPRADEVVATAEDAARAFREVVSIAGGNEGFFVLPLDAERRALATPILVSLGEPATTTVDVGEVFSPACEDGRGYVSVFEMLEN